MATTTVTSRIDMIAPRTTTMATASTPRSSFDDPEISGGSFATWGDESALKAGFQSSKRPSGSLSGPSPFIMAGGTDSLATG